MPKPRIAIAGFMHETNTFAPLPTDYADFARGAAFPELVEGAAVIETLSGLNLPMGGFIGAADDFDLIPILWCFAEPSGTVLQSCFDRIAGTICDGIRAAGDIDGVYLDLHGAMVTEDHEDGEAELLRRVREVTGPDLPIAVSLDLHGNMSPDFFRRASSVAVYRTYPHVDMAATGARAATLLRAELARGKPLAGAYRQVNYIPPITGQSTMREPGARLYAHLPELARGGVSSVDFAFGFPPADIRHCGPSIFAYGTDAKAVNRAADAMLMAVNAAEGAFANPLIPAREAVRAAMRISATAARPVVICDPQDNPGAGAIGDSTGLLAALIDEGAAGACIGMIWDPGSAAQAHAAGLGAAADFQIGGSHPEIGGPPIRIRAEVERLSDGDFTFTGPMFGGGHARLGPMACLRLRGDNGADLRIVIGSARAQNADQEMFRVMGVEPGDQKIVAVKSAVHFLADYQPIAEKVIFAEAPGANPCALERIPYRRLRPGVRLGPLGPAFDPENPAHESPAS